MNQIPADRKYFTSLNVGLACTFGGHLAIGGDGKFSEKVSKVAKAHGFVVDENTGEWALYNGGVDGKFAAVRDALDACE